MSVAACAAIVERGDPDRFLAAMAAPVAARDVLFPIYAFNVEIARAPWMSEEPLIAEMRLQWWADALGEIAGGGPVRRHEVATPLADVLDADGARILERCIDARRRDAQRLRLETVPELRAYLAATGGALIWAATRALDPGRGWGPSDAARAEAAGTLSALANYLLAVPALLARGVNPLPEMSERDFEALLTEVLAEADRATAGRPARAQKIAELAAWRARGIVIRALRTPEAIVAGHLAESEFARRAALLWRSLQL